MVYHKPQFFLILPFQGCAFYDEGDEDSWLAVGVYKNLFTRIVHLATAVLERSVRLSVCLSVSNWSTDNTSSIFILFSTQL